MANAIKNFEKLKNNFMIGYYLFLSHLFSYILIQNVKHILRTYVIDTSVVLEICFPKIKMNINDL